MTSSFNEDFEKALMTLPEPLGRYLVMAFDASQMLWIAVLGLWLAYGLIARTTPFRLLPEDPWTLQRGRKRQRMGFRKSTVVDSRRDVQRLEEVRIPVDEYGRKAGREQRRGHTTRAQTIHIRDAAGKEDTIQLMNERPLEAQPGHRILEVFDPQAHRYLFLYNFDVQQFVFMSHYKPFIKMRPFILLPLWFLLVSWAFTQPAWVLGTAVVATPYLYLLTMWIVNLRRRYRFARTMAPELVKAASAHGGTEYIGSAEMGVTRV